MYVALALACDPQERRAESCDAAFSDFVHLHVTSSVWVSRTRAKTTSVAAGGPIFPDPSSLPLSSLRGASYSTTQGRND